MRIKKCLLLLLSLAMMVVTFGACGNTPPSNTSETVEPFTSDSSVETDPLDPGLEAIDGGGREFHIITRETEGYLFAYNEVLSINDSADRVNSAVVARNRYIEDKYNVLVVADTTTSSRIESRLEQDFNGGTHIYDLAMPMTEKAFNLALKGILTEWDLIPYVDVSRDYWMSDFFSYTTIGGYHFFCPGAANISAYNTIGVTFFNKVLLAQLELESPYDMVENGTWTVEQMKEMCTVATFDVNNDGMNESDRYGLAVNAFCWQPFFYSSGMTMVEKDDNDIPYLSAIAEGTNELVLDRLTDIVALVNDRSKAILTNQYSYEGTVNLETEIFLGDRSLFWVEAIYGQYNLRNMESAYGILPMPVWNANDPYISYTHAGHSSVMCLPRTASEVNLSGSIMEDMTYYSEKIIIPEFYEQTIRVRGVRDEESYEMLDIIYETIIIDLAQVMKNSGLILDGGVRELLIDNSTDVSSFFGSNKSALVNTLNDFSSRFTVRGNEQYTG